VVSVRIHLLTVEIMSQQMVEMMEIITDLMELMEETTDLTELMEEITVQLMVQITETIVILIQKMIVILLDLVMDVGILPKIFAVVVIHMKMFYQDAKTYNLDNRYVHNVINVKV